MHSKNTLFRPWAHSAQLGTDHLGDKIIGYLIKDTPKAIKDTPKAIPQKQ